MNSAEETTLLLAKAARKVLGRNFDIGSASGQVELREFARELAASPDDPGTELVLRFMEALQPPRESRLHVTKGVAPPIIQLDIPEADRVLQKGRGYFRAPTRDSDFNPGL
ncbi:hypothetical protein [Pseudomonas sp. 8 R 14]|uniref:hypothetical protein n=1 Tax=Pseudomonas sp. 8 R 14 TaxID=1844092 RepID=UPI00081C0F2F|nr:hypothetical protein [Pseudomonas sp. 8 R 14]